MIDNRKKQLDFYLANVPGLTEEIMNKFTPHWGMLDIEEAIIATMRKADNYDGNDYKKRYPDVAAASIDPISHFVRCGIHEKRFIRQKDAVCVNSRRIIRQGALECLYADPLDVSWLITAMCNYNCSYCFGHKKLDRSKFTPIADLKKAVDHIASTNRSYYSFSFTGGEPTAHPNFVELLEYLRSSFGKKLDWITIVSNGSRQYDLYERLAAMASDVNINLAISLHTEFLDVEHILSMINLSGQKLHLGFNFMLNPDKFDFCREIFETLLKARMHRPFTMDIMLLKAPPSFTAIDPRYNESHLNWRKECQKRFAIVCKESKQSSPVRYRQPRTKYWEYEEHGERVYRQQQFMDRSLMLMEGMFNFKGLHCCLGAHTLAIEADGSIRGARCLQAPCRYNIFKENPFCKPDFIEAIKCAQVACECTNNDNIPKFPSETEALAYIKTFRSFTDAGA